MEAQNTFSLRLPAQVVQVTTETVFTFEVKVTNFLQSTSSATFDLTVRNTGLPLPIVTLGTPAEQIFSNQDVNFAIETRRLPISEGCSGGLTENDGGIVEVIWEERIIYSENDASAWIAIPEDENRNPNVLTLSGKLPETLYEYRAKVGYEETMSTNSITTVFRGRTAPLPPVVLSIAAPAAAAAACSFSATVSVSTASRVVWVLSDEASSVRGELTNVEDVGEVQVSPSSVGQHLLKVSAYPFDINVDSRTGLGQSVPMNEATQSIRVFDAPWPQASLHVPFEMPDPAPVFLSANGPVNRVPTNCPRIRVAVFAPDTSACTDASTAYFTVGLCAAPCGAVPKLQAAVAVEQESPGRLAPVSLQPTEGSAYQYVLVATRTAEEQALVLESADGTTVGVVLAYSTEFYVDSTPTGGVVRVLGGVSSPEVGFAGQTAFTIRTSDWQDEAPAKLLASFYVLRMDESQASSMQRPVEGQPLSAAAVPELPPVDWANAESPFYWETLGWALVGGPKQGMEQRDVMLGPGTYFVVVRVKDDMGMRPSRRPPASWTSPRRCRTSRRCGRASRGSRRPTTRTRSSASSTRRSRSRTSGSRKRRRPTPARPPSQPRKPKLMTLKSRRWLRSE
jgi:hypothetical protein